MGVKQALIKRNPLHRSVWQKIGLLILPLLMKDLHKYINLVDCLHFSLFISVKLYIYNLWKT